MKAASPARRPSSALLLGPDHIDLGEIAIAEVSPRLAVGLSRGRFPKGYAHVDVNEDGVYGADTDGMTVLAVADGHRGFDAAAAAIAAIAQFAPVAADLAPAAAVTRLVGRAIEEIKSIVPRLAPPRNASRTALTVVAIRSATMAAASFGDSVCYLARTHRVEQIGTRAGFLSAATDLERTSPQTVQLRNANTVVVASDGFVDFVADGSKVVRSVRRLGAREAVGEILNAAFAGGAGDNIAVGVAKMTDSR